MGKTETGIRSICLHYEILLSESLKMLEQMDVKNGELNTGCTFGSSSTASEDLGFSYANPETNLNTTQN